MEILPSFSAPFSLYGSLKRYWRRRKYQHLGDYGTKNKSRSTRTIRLGGKKSKHCWKVRAIPKARVKAVSPTKALRMFHGAYIKAMIGLAGTVGSSYSAGMFGDKRIPKSRDVPTVAPFLENEKKLLYEMYSILFASHEIVAY
ncbi:hypothetical protein GIB67_028869 [Kingdonia uniflora]|uniref:Uncharacterized protein n=1 Tax=Kingdonia uniflora TaxID=39325 RepID=A0A7J7LTL1_9MAGN|nr:hypothetical protein GIB67_028869 [Kingdonia uniflora]